MAPAAKARERLRGRKRWSSAAAMSTERGDHPKGHSIFLASVLGRRTSPLTTYPEICGC